MLIDVFYEVKVWLIVSGVDDLEWFYVEGEGVFEFECIVLCLCEMCDVDWGKSQVLVVVVQDYVCQIK